MPLLQPYAAAALDALAHGKASSRLLPAAYLPAAGGGVTKLSAYALMALASDTLRTPLPGWDPLNIKRSTAPCITLTHNLHQGYFFVKGPIMYVCYGWQAWCARQADQQRVFKLLSSCSVAGTPAHLATDHASAQLANA